MQTVLIATDFSAASRNASLFGIEFARQLDAKVILLNAYQQPHQIAVLNVEVSGYGVLKEIAQKLADEAGFLTQNNKETIECVCERGDPETTIVNIGKEKHANFIIIGLKGSGKNLSKVFGNTATALANKTQLPLLIIPEKAVFTSLKSMVFASDMNIDTDTYYLAGVSSIAKLFSAKLYVVKVVTGEQEESFEVLESLPVPSLNIEISDTTFSSPVDSDISHALTLFVKEQSIDILVMTPHKHDWKDKLFKKSETNDMIFHTHIPLMILPEKHL